MVWVLTRARVGRVLASVRASAQRDRGHGQDRSSRTAARVSPPAVHIVGSPAGDGSITELAAFVYELLDAHDDTARLASGLAPNVLWDAHLDYRRALQRKGRDVL